MPFGQDNYIVNFDDMNCAMDTEKKKNNQYS